MRATTGSETRAQAARSALGMTTPRPETGEIASRSTDKRSERLFTRTHAGAPGFERSQSTAYSRAWGLTASATASSRSMMTESAPLCSALSKRSG